MHLGFRGGEREKRKLPHKGREAARIRFRWAKREEQEIELWGGNTFRLPKQGNLYTVALEGAHAKGIDSLRKARNVARKRIPTNEKERPHTFAFGGVKKRRKQDGNFFGFPKPAFTASPF